MNETASMVAFNAENTKQASQIATATASMANKGMTEMTDMVAAMEEIKKSSDKVSKIVKTIDEIAFQTNILAINATVEAARAGGESGRSFAVVAQEVRDLARRSADASAETTEIIAKNIVLTNAGRKVSQDVAASLNEITEKAEQLNKLMTEINAASAEQASGIRQINLAMGEMEKVTQDNAAVAEENAALSNNVKDEIKNLESAVSIAKDMVKKENKDETEQVQERIKSTSAESNRLKLPEVDDISDKPQAKLSAKLSKPSNLQTINRHDAEKIIPLEAKNDF